MIKLQSLTRTRVVRTVHRLNKNEKKEKSAFVDTRNRKANRALKPKSDESSKQGLSSANERWRGEGEEAST